jgi:Na+-transporting NADH:ubiquinone oxidoreductase subunit E
MWLGPYDFIGLLGLFIQSVFVQNILFFNFLGMCSFLACSNKITTANGLGSAVALVITVTGILNWFVHNFITGEGALSWLGAFGVNGSELNLSFLELVIYISVIAGFTQVLEIAIEKFSPSLYSALGVFLPLIAVNCAILGACLFATAREYAFIPNLVYVFGSGIGWWLAIALMAAIREKLNYSNIVPGLRGMGITLIMSGLIAMTFMALTGITLDNANRKTTAPIILNTGKERAP